MHQKFQKFTIKSIFHSCRQTYNYKLIEWHLNPKSLSSLPQYVSNRSYLVMNSSIPSWIHSRMFVTRTKDPNSIHSTMTLPEDKFSKEISDYLRALLHSQVTEPKLCHNNHISTNRDRTSLASCRPQASRRVVRIILIGYKFSEGVFTK